MEAKENMLAKTEQAIENKSLVAGYGTVGGFELMQRQAKALAASTLIPKNFQGNTADCIIALEMAQRIGASPFAVLQNLYIVHGKPSWSAQFLVACINACGRFSPLRYRQIGTKGEDSWGVIAWAKDLHDGEVLESPEVTIDIAKKEGWFSKSGSKWQTIPELMLRYRAATFFARTYAPDVTMGITTKDEAFDIAPDVDVTDSPLKKEHAADVEVEEPETVDGSNEDPVIAAAFKDVDEDEGAVEQAAEDQPDEEPTLTPVADLSKSACIAEINLHDGTAYQAGIIDTQLVGGTKLKDCPVSMLRSIVSDVRQEAEAAQAS